MSVFIVPVLIALLVKLYLMVLLRQRQRLTSLLLILIVTFITSDLFQVLSFIRNLDGDSSAYLFLGYFVSTVFVVAYAFLHSISTMQILFDRYFKFFVLLASFVLSVLIFFTDSIVSGYKVLGFSATAVAGEYYWLYSSYMVLCFLMLPILFVYSFMQSISDDHRKLMARHMLALLPLYLSVIVITSLTFFGMVVNATSIIPLASSVYLVIIASDLKDVPKEDYKVFLPGSPERNFANGIIEVGAKFAHGECSLSQANSEIEGLLIEYERQTGESVEYLE